MPVTLHGEVQQCLPEVEGRSITTCLLTCLMMDILIGLIDAYAEVFARHAMLLARARMLVARHVVILPLARHAMQEHRRVPSRNNACACAAFECALLSASGRSRNARG